MFTFLPEMIQNALEYVNKHNVYEIRIRLNSPIYINYLGNYAYLGLYGITKQRELALTCEEADIADCMYRAGNYAVYSIEEELKKGFITTKKGVRIGVSGEYVIENGNVVTIRNVTSLCVRIPHEIIGAGDVVYQRCMTDRVHNVLIFSPPGYGKTTILRDLTRQIAERMRKNVLVCDERAEISVGEMGETCDVVKFCDKKTAFEAGIRALRPDVIVTDELTPQDYSVIERATHTGVNVLATAHLHTIKDIPKDFFNIFDYFVCLSDNQIGKISKIYDKNGKEITYG